jgi:hypothetical protein
LGNRTRTPERLNARTPAFRKVVSGKQLYNFDRRDFDRWRHAL